MDGILHWKDAIFHFGNNLKDYRTELSKAAYSTYALLVCRSAMSGTSDIENRRGEHAEERLVLCDMWKKDLDAALSAWDHLAEPMIILLIINRSPCSYCSHILSGALHYFNDKYALTTEKQHFILASLGHYNSNKPVEYVDGYARTYTTERGLREMKEAGWKLCTVDFGHGLTRRGSQLHAYLKNI
jgi:hypothetical protein